MKLEFFITSRMFCVDLRCEHSFSTFWLCIFRISHFFQKKQPKTARTAFSIRHMYLVLFSTKSAVHFSCILVKTLSYVLLNNFFSPSFVSYPNLPKFLIDDVILDLGFTLRLWDLFFGFSRQFYIEIHLHDTSCNWWELLNSSILHLFNSWNDYQAFIKMLRWRHSREFLLRWRHTFQFEIWSRAPK